MDKVNVSVNASRSATDNVAAIIGTATADGVLLLIVFFATVINVIVIAALIGTSDLVRSLRVILVNILGASVMGALGSTIYHISSLTLRLSSSSSGHGRRLCRVTVFLLAISTTGRVLFTAFYGIAVFIVVYFWNQPVLAPRNTKYFIIASAVVWLLAVATGIPSLPEESVSGFCSISNNITRDIQDMISRFALIVAVPYSVVSCIAIIVTLMFVIMTFCYIKKKSIGDFRESKKALVNFGLFLMIVQGINTFAQIFMPLLALRISHLLEYPIAFIVAVALSELSQIPTNVLILIFFKPVRVRVKKWMCCCCHGRKQATKSRSILTNNRAAADV